MCKRALMLPLASVLLSHLLCSVSQGASALFSDGAAPQDDYEEILNMSRTIDGCELARPLCAFPSVSLSCDGLTNTLSLTLPSPPSLSLSQYVCLTLCFSRGQPAFEEGEEGESAEFGLIFLDLRLRAVSSLLCFCVSLFLSFPSV